MHLRKLLTIILVASSGACVAQSPVAVILDTDIGPDFDDVGAMALLHALADDGEATILGVVSCNGFSTTVPTISVINNYFKRPEIPIGIGRGSLPNKNCPELWAEAIISRFPHNVKRNEDAGEAVGLYRKLLAGQPDKSVTIVSIGFFTNLANLLSSEPDQYSPLGGTQLVSKKVTKLVSMAAGLGKEGKGFREFNVWVDADAARKVLTGWPTPLLLSGFEIGERIFTGEKFIGDMKIKNSPVKEAYQIALEANHKQAGQHSWDQTAVLVAIKGYEAYFNIRKLNFEITSDGTSLLIPGDRLLYLTDKMPSQKIAEIIDGYMMHEPR